METWQETVLVANVASRANIPVLSFAARSITPPLASVRWPNLVRMANNDSLQMKCVASIVGSYNWRSVIAIYEDDGYGADSRVTALFSDELQAVGSKIEHWLAFPSLSTLSNPEAFVLEELGKMKDMQTRVFIILESSLELASYLVTAAKAIGLMEKNSVWITMDYVTNLFHTVNSSTMSSMEGILGIRTHFPRDDPLLVNFPTQFRKKFQSTYPEEEKVQPGLYGVRAYDSISTVAMALESSNNKGLPSTSRSLLRNVLSSNFSGLSGEIRFENGEMVSSGTYEIINVVGDSCKVLKYWSPMYGFTDHVELSTRERNRRGGDRVPNVLGSLVYWPGKHDKIPLGWARKMVIGIPGGASSGKFVKLRNGEEPTGYCIEVFKYAVNKLSYDLQYEFKPLNVSYNDLIDQVYFKNIDAAVGDFTILANRTKYVELTQPYAESGLRMIAPFKKEGKAWMFVKPFTAKLWIVVGIVFLYTMFVIWILEHRSNQDFQGPWRNQISTALWFTFCTLFFAHRESLRNSFTRVVMSLWLLTVFIVTSSYTASLTSMLTVKHLDPTVSIDTLKKSSSTIGYDGSKLIETYLENVLDFPPNNIINIGHDGSYSDIFSSGKVKAAFVDRHNEKAIISINCKDYKDIELKHKFGGGLGFVFPKGSPMADDFSEAFLKLSEDGTLPRLYDTWFPPYSQCANEDNNLENLSLNLNDFWGIFVVMGITSTVMLATYVLHIFMEFRCGYVPSSYGDTTVWNQIKAFGTYYRTSQFHGSHKETVSPNLPGNRQKDPLGTIEMPKLYIGEVDKQTRSLQVAYSFPSPDRPVREFTFIHGTQF
ncbi:hypothetical protein ACHQM5_030006 [Ranunculus cassubicifolius]